MKVVSYNTHIFGESAGYWGGKLSNIATDVADYATEKWKELWNQPTPKKNPTVSLYFHDDERQKEIGHYVRHSGADVVGLCEVWPDTRKDWFAAGLRDVYPHSFYHKSIETQGDGLILLSKHRIVKSKLIAFKNSGGADRCAVKRCFAIWVEYNHRIVRVFFTHTQAGYKDNAYTDARMANLREIVSLMQQEDAHLPTIFMGDLNVPTSEYGDMKDIFPGMWDAHANLSASQRVTCESETDFMAKRFNADDKNDTFDYVLYSLDKWKLKSAAVIRDWTFRTGDATYQCSDHYPVTAGFELS